MTRTDFLRKLSEGYVDLQGGTVSASSIVIDRPTIILNGTINGVPGDATFKVKSDSLTLRNVETSGQYGIRLDGKGLELDLKKVIHRGGLGLIHGAEGCGVSSLSMVDCDVTDAARGVYIASFDVRNVTLIRCFFLNVVNPSGHAVAVYLGRDDGVNSRKAQEDGRMGNYVLHGVHVQNVRGQKANGLMLMGDDVLAHSLIVSDVNADDGNNCEGFYGKGLNCRLLDSLFTDAGMHQGMVAVKGEASDSPNVGKALGSDWLVSGCRFRSSGEQRRGIFLNHGATVEDCQFEGFDDACLVNDTGSTLEGMRMRGLRFEGQSATPIVIQGDMPDYEISDCQTDYRRLSQLEPVKGRQHQQTRKLTTV